MSNLEMHRADFMGYVNATPEGEPVKLHILDLNPEARGTTARFAVLYPNDRGELTAMWGGFDGDEPSAEERAAWWPFMVYHRRPASGFDRFPAFHFVLKGYGYSKEQELAEAIATAIQRPVRYARLTGWLNRFSEIIKPEGSADIARLDYAGSGDTQPEAAADSARRIDPSIPLEDEQDGQKFFDALCNGELNAEDFERLEALDYQAAARVWRVIRRA